MKKLGIALFLLAQPALARPVVALAPGQGGTLAVGFDAQGVLRTRMCGGAKCGIDGATEIPIAAEEKNHVAQATLSVVRYAPARRAVVVEVPSADATRKFSAVVIANGKEPHIVFAGQTGYTDGEWG